MSQNDLIALESNFSNWTAERGAGLTSVDPFVYYCVEHFLKAFHLNDEDIIYGITDGPNDGGVDAIYFVVDRRNLVRDDTTFESTEASKINLVIIQVESTDGFKMTKVEKLFMFTDDLLDLSRSAETLTAKYHQHLIQIMQAFKEKYHLLVGGFPSVSVDYYYITKGDELEPDSKATEAATKVTQKVREHLSQAECNFHFVNAQGLLEQLMLRPPRERLLVWATSPMAIERGWVGLVKLRNFFSFITDEHGDLAEQIFESNVRGFQQRTAVNLQIRKSLDTDKHADFWLLNNGVTIIAKQTATGTLGRLNLEDPQIVNGLQTAREVFNYFTEKKPQNEERLILVKVIETADEVVRDAIIKATNSQNPMLAASLRATDPIHRQVEDLFKQYGLYYDRRKGFYKDNKKPIKKIISIMELVQAVVSILLQRPDDARARPSDYIKDDQNYEAVFGKDRIPLGIYLTCILLLRRVEGFLDSLADLQSGEKRNIKFYVLACLACTLTKELEPSAAKVAFINPPSIGDNVVRDCYKRVWKRYVALGKKEEKDKLARGTELLKRLKSDIRHQLSGKRKRASNRQLSKSRK